jgi:hypothetical protein
MPSFTNCLSMPSPSRPTLFARGIAIVFIACVLQFVAYNSYAMSLQFNSSSLHRVLLRLPQVAAIRLQSPFIYRTSTLKPLPHSLPKQSSRNFSANHKMASSTSFMDAVKARRTYYALNKEAPISDDAIVQIVNDAVRHVPSSFNNQSARLVVLLKKEHDQFWEFVKEVLKPMVPAEQFAGTEQKINGFKAGYGTVSDRLVLDMAWHIR